MTTPKMTTPEMAVHQQDATLAAWVMMVVAAFAPAAAVMLVVHGSLVTAVAALGTAVVALVAVFLLLPFDQMAQVCERLGQWRRVMYALVPHWHAISWQHSPALWRHRASLAMHAETLAPHAGQLLADGAPLLRTDRLEVLVPLLPVLIPHIEPLAQRVDQLAPYFDQLLPHLGTLAPHLPQMLPHIDGMISGLDHLIDALPHFVAVADAVGPRIGEVLDAIPYQAAEFQDKMIEVLDRIGPVLLRKHAAGLIDHLPQLLPHLQALGEEMDTLEPHLPLLFTHLDLLAPHLDAMMAHRQTLMPHIGALLPVLPSLASSLRQMLEPRTFDLLAPHLATLVPALPLLAPHAEALLPHVGILIKHVDVLTPQCDWLLIFTVKPNWAELLPYTEQLVPFVEDFKPHAEMLFSSFEQLVPHLPVLVQHLDRLVPELGDPDMDIGLLAHKPIVRMLPMVAALLPEAPRRLREAEIRRERRLAQLKMPELWRLLYKYSGEERAEHLAEKITELGSTRAAAGGRGGEVNAAAAEAAMKHEAIRELLTLIRHREATDIDYLFDPLAGVYTHPLDELEGTDLPSPTIADM